MDDTEESLPQASSVETNIKELMGLFDLPAFARRGQAVEIALSHLHDRCRVVRVGFLEFVRLRLRQWSRSATGPDTWSAVFTTSIEPLWPLCEAEKPEWADVPAPRGRQRLIARDLISAVLRFNRRWIGFLSSLNLEPANNAIEQYNRYYVFEKECVMGSARLAARHFFPVPKLTIETLLHDHPILPVPQLRD